MYSGVASKGGCVQPFGELLPQIFDPTRFRPEPSWQPFSGVKERGVVPTMQMHYNESKGYSQADVVEGSACSSPVALDLSTLRSRKPQGQDVVLPRAFLV